MKKKFLGLITVVLVLSIVLTCVGCGSSSSSSKSDDTKVEEQAENKQEDTTQVLFDNEYCSCILTGYDDSILQPFALKVTLENKTADKELMFSVQDVSVNGFMCDPFWADSVAAGKKANATIGWMSSTLEDAGISGTIETIELHFRVTDFNDWMADAVIDQVITLNPGIKIN